MPRVVFLLSLFALLGGCAFTDSGLILEIPAETDVTGSMSLLAPTEFSIGELNDHRQDTTRVGYKKNRYGMTTADIFLNRPVTEIVEGALSTGLRRNGQHFRHSRTFR